MAVDLEGAKSKQRRQTLTLQQKIQLWIRQSIPADKIKHGGLGRQQQYEHNQPSDPRLATKQQAAQRE